MAHRTLVETNYTKWIAKSVFVEGLSKSSAEIRMVDLGSKNRGLISEKTIVVIRVSLGSQVCPLLVIYSL